MSIINLTQHAATMDQIEAGVVDVTDRERLSRLLTVQVGGPDGFAAMIPSVQAEFLNATAQGLLQAFVLPEVARVTRDYLASFAQGGSIPVTDVDALNARAMPRVQAMVGGFAPLMAALIPLLKEHGCDPLYALSDRVTVETVQGDGTVKKTSVFQHMGFYPA